MYALDVNSSENVLDIFQLNMAAVFLNYTG